VAAHSQVCTVFNCSDIGVENPGNLLGRMNVMLCLFFAGVVLYTQRPKDWPIPLFKETLGHWRRHQINDARMGWDLQTL